MKNMLNLDGKTVLVTGAAGGLGTHFSETLGAAGARVVLAGRRKAPLQALSGKLTELGIENLPVAMDATDPDSVCGAFDQIHRVFGVVDVVVCNAGLGINKKSLALSVNEFIEVIDVNLKGSWIVANETARRLIAADRQGSVIMITSILGHRVAGAVLPYTTSKAALEQMTKALALEWARHGIRVNALAPGYILTDLNRDFFESQAGKALIGRIPQRRLGQPDDLSGALLLLASDASNYMTGSCIVVDGGHLQSSL